MLANHGVLSFFFCFCFIIIIFFYFTILYWFCHISTWIHHGCTRVPNPETSSHLPLHTIPPGHPSVPAPSILHPASNLDWQFISYMILYVFQCHSPKSSHLIPLPQSPKDCSIHLCLFWTRPNHKYLKNSERTLANFQSSGLFLPHSILVSHH